MASLSDNDRRHDWQIAYVSETKGRAPSEQATALDDGVVVEPLYGPHNTPTPNAADSFPGAVPFRRGVRASMYRNRPWTIRQYAGFSTAEESNAFYRAALAGGQTGLSVAFDLATHRGYDSDHPRVSGDVGKAGVAIDSVEDMRVLFDGIPLGDVSVSMTMNGAVAPVLACFIVAAEEQGVALDQLSGTMQNDILKEFIVRNTFVYPPAPSMRIVADVIQFATANMPSFNPVSISGYHFHEAGATPAQELAFTIADGIAYVKAALERGLDVDEFAPRLSFFFAVGIDFFAEVAKLRAARVLWADAMRQFSPTKPESSMLRMHCQTSGVSLTAQDPLNNVVRTAYEALAAVLGGTQSLHTNSYDEAIALPSDEAARIARNTQLILANESGVTRTVDPLGGSWYVESLTDQLIDAAKVLMAEVDQAGGMVAAIEAGWPKLRIAESASRRQARIERGDEVIVGVNKFVAEGASAIAVRAIDAVAVRDAQVARLTAIRSARDEADVQRLLGELTNAARGTLNLVEVCITCARARATVGEMSMAMEAVFGRYSPPMSSASGVYLGVRQLDADFQRMVERVRQFGDRVGRPPRLYVAKLGQDGHDRGAYVIASGFVDLGFEVSLGALFATPEEVAREAIADDVHVIGVSSLAAGHSVLVPELVGQLHALGAPHIKVVVGGVVPDADVAMLKAAGVARVFGPGSSVVAAASEVLDVLDEAGVEH